MCLRFILLTITASFLPITAVHADEQSRDVFTVNPLGETRAERYSKIELSAMQPNRVYLHFSEVRQRQVQSVAMASDVFEIDFVPNVAYEYWETLHLRDRSKNLGHVSLQWWDLGINTVLPGEFFQLDNSRRFILTLVPDGEGQYGMLWREVAAEDFDEYPIIIRAFSTVGDGEIRENGEYIYGRQGNGYLAWKYQVDEDGQRPSWNELPLKYKEKTNSWIINEKGVETGKIFAISSNATIYMSLGHKNSDLADEIWPLDIGSVVSGKFLGLQGELRSVRYELFQNDHGPDFRVVGRDKPFRLEHLKTDRYFVYDDQERKWTHSRHVRPSRPSFSPGGSSSYVRSPSSSNPTHHQSGRGYNDPGYNPNRSAFNPDGSRSLMREQRNQALRGVPYDANNLREQQRYCTLYGCP